MADWCPECTYYRVGYAQLQPYCQKCGALVHTELKVKSVIKVEKKDYENWIQEIRKIKSALQVVFDFGKGFFGSHPKLMDVQEAINKLDHLAEFLERIMPKTPEYSKDPSGRWSP